MDVDCGGDFEIEVESEGDGKGGQCDGDSHYPRGITAFAITGDVTAFSHRKRLHRKVLMGCVGDLLFRHVGSVSARFSLSLGLLFQHVSVGPGVGRQISVLTQTKRMAK